MRDALSPAIARVQSAPKGAQRGFAFRAEGWRLETRPARRKQIAGRVVSIALLDVNVLVALFDPAHNNHEDAHRWFGRNRKHGWATCPITTNGCIRVLSNPAYPTVEATPAEVAGRLRSLCSTADHHFWADSVSLMDEALFRPSMIGGHQTIGGHQKITDAYLLGLAVRNHGLLATFDRSIPMKAVHGAVPGNLVLIGST